MDKGLIFAFLLDGKGGAKALTFKELSKCLPRKGPVWIHLDWDDKDAHNWLENEASLETGVAEALLAENVRPRFEEYETGVQLNLRGLNFNPGQHKEDMITIRIWLDKNRLITVRKQPLMAILDVKTRIEKGKGPKTLEGVMVKLAERLFDRMNNFIAVMEEDIDDVEEGVLTEKLVDLRDRLKDIRIGAISLRRHIQPQREALTKFLNSDYEFTNQRLFISMRESKDDVTRYLENLDLVRERSSIIQDEISNRLAEKLNKNMYLLSIIAAVFLPLGFLTGLFGINIGGMPGVEDPQAFWVFTGSLVTLGLVIAGIFKFQKWI